MSPVSRSFRRGFTIVEMLISMIVLAIVGAGLVQMVMSQGRFMDHQEASRSSRAVSSVEEQVSSDDRAPLTWISAAATYFEDARIVPEP